MNIKCSFKILFFLISMVSSVACKEKDNVAPILTVSETVVSFPSEGGTMEIELICNNNWTISNPASSWVELSQTMGEKGNDTIQITLSPNTISSGRSVILDVNSPNGQSRRISVNQWPFIYPSYNTMSLAPDETGMSSTAVELAAKIKLGWNLGNALEAPGGEGSWSAPITESYVNTIKQLGFNAIRIPCGYNFHMDDEKTAHIDPKWINRVKEVIGYCINNDMYVLLNIHWDGGWLENNCTKAKQDSVNAKQKAFWEQIATAMRDFDEHLMFASANEPNTKDAEEMSVLLSHHQTFVNAVRSTGGHNTYRVLVIQGATELLNAFPKDPTPNRMMYEWHNYTPYTFTCLDKDVDWGNMLYYWGAGHNSTIELDRNASYGLENEHLNGFEMLKTRFIDKGIPVLLGEYGAYRRGGSVNVPKDLETHNASVDYWITYVTHQAVIHGVKPFFWDTGGMIDRKTNVVLDQRSLDAVMAGSIR